MTIYGLSPTHSARPPKPSKGFQQQCSYGPTTTQQQAHNRTPAGFEITIYGSNRHNSKLTIELLQVLQHKCSYGPTTTQQQAHKELLQDLQTFSQQIN